MKGRLYQSKPLAPKSEFLELFVSKKKPWEESYENIYTWRSSIPEKWISLKGQKYFKHISQKNRPQLSIDFFRNNNKYSNPFTRHSRDRGKSSFLMPIVKQNSEKLQRRRNSQIAQARVLETEVKNPELNVFISQSQCMSEEKRSKTHISKNSKIGEGENKTQKIAKEYPTTSKGLFGWKLKHLKELKPKKQEIPDSIHRPQIEDLPFAKVNSKRMQSLS